MAERRMFAKAVIGSGKFLRMPATARLLYYDLGMEADDDGIVEAFRVMRTTGATDDDLKILCAKGFVRVLNEELVTKVTDWKVNNYIQKDRYRPSVYAALIEACADSDQPVYNTDTTCIQNVSGLYTQDSKGKVSQGKVSQGKVSQGESIGASDDATPTAPAKKTKKEFVPPTVEGVAVYCKDKGLNTIDPEYFVRFYSESDWIKANGEPVRNWKSTVLTWAQRDKDRGVTAKQQNGGSFDTDEFYEAALKRSYGAIYDIAKKN